MVRSPQKNVRVVVDGRSPGLSSAGQCCGVAVEDYTAELVGAGLYWKGRVTISRGQTTEVRAAPQEVGSICYDLPACATGTAQGLGRRHDIAGSGVLEHLLVGRYNVEVSGGDCEGVSETITIRKGARHAVKPVPGRSEAARPAGYRLPTEAEWEYAAGGAAESHATSYAGSEGSEISAWYAGNSGRRIHPVGQKIANELGLHDMSGNVWEWCWDWKGDYSASDCNDPSGLRHGTLGVARGGSWRNYLRGVRVASRTGYPPSVARDDVGSRVARTTG